MSRATPTASPRREKLLLCALMALGLVILTFAVFGDQGWREVRHLRSERSELAAEIESLRLHRDDLRREVDGLKNNPRVTETRARADLGMVKPGETVFLLPEHHAPKP